MTNDEQQDLDGELNDGKKAAILLVEHVQRMGAANCAIPVIVDGELWDVTATRSKMNDLEI